MVTIWHFSTGEDPENAVGNHTASIVAGRMFEPSIGPRYIEGVAEEGGMEINRPFKLPGKRVLAGRKSKM